MAAVRALADDLVPGAVSFERGLSSAELAERYRSAHAFVSLSEHEGFCIPLLEAFHFGVPVVAGRFEKFDPEAALGLAEKMRVRNAFIPPTALITSGPSRRCSCTAWGFPRPTTWRARGAKRGRHTLRECSHHAPRDEPSTQEPEAGTTLVQNQT